MSKLLRVLAIGVALTGVAAASAQGASRRTWDAGERRVAELLRLMDQDKNGRVSKDEFLAFMSAEFDRLDRDKSGELTASELSRLPYAPSGTHVNPHR